VGANVRVSRRARVISLDLGQKAFSFVAGQAVSLGLATQTIRKPYSIASSPAETRSNRRMDLLVGLGEDGRLGAHLEPLSVGSVVGLQGPFGRFRLPPHQDGRTLVFVAGGTGIAPLRSMLSSALARLRPPAIEVIYSARTPSDLIFDDEFRRWHREGRIRYWPTVTRRAGPAWRGRRGRIDRDMLRAALRPAPVCLLCGPASFVTDVTVMLRAEGVRRTSIRFEEY
jgi:ferredoxin-NADP reductase